MIFSTFIENHLDAIVAEWESFARTLLPAAATMSDLALRNHSREILQAIVADMRTVQSEEERDERCRRLPEWCWQVRREPARAHG